MSEFLLVFAPHFIKKFTGRFNETQTLQGIYFQQGHNNKDTGGGGGAKARKEYEVRNNKEQVMVRAVQLPVTPAETSIVKPANRNVPFSGTFIPAIV